MKTALFTATYDRQRWRHAQRQFPNGVESGTAVAVGRRRPGRPHGGASVGIYGLDNCRLSHRPRYVPGLGSAPAQGDCGACRRSGRRCYPPVPAPGRGDNAAPTAHSRVSAEGWTDHLLHLPGSQMSVRHQRSRRCIPELDAGETANEVNITDKHNLTYQGRPGQPENESHFMPKRSG